MLADCDVIEIFPIYGQFWAIQKLDSGRTVCKTYIFFKSNPLFYIMKLASYTLPKEDPKNI